MQSTISQKCQGSLYHLTGLPDIRRYITSSPLCLSGSPGMRTHDGTTATAAAAME